jgi:YD repeat-containing protein
MTPSRLRPTARTLFAALAALALALTNVAAGCPGDPPPPIDLPVLATTAAVGSLPGSTSVSDDGTFTYSAPIPVPPGRAGMQPSLALSYASTPSEGSLGVGFALSGLSSITRCGQSVAIDGQHRGVELDDDDRLCLDGARLLAVEGEDMQAGTIYRTETETWRRIETVESDRVGVTGPVTLRVRMPDGRERLYGASNDSRLEITRADGSRVVATWFLTLERDPRGNAIRYGYDHVTPTLPAELAALADPDPATYDLVRISRIDYTGFVTPGGVVTSGSRSVRFDYAVSAQIPDVGVVEDTGGLVEAPPPEDGFVEGSFGWRATTFPLESIRTYVDEELVHELRLAGDAANAARRYRLQSAQLCANAPGTAATEDDLVCLPPTRFTWRDRRPEGSPADDPRYGYATFQARDVAVTPVPTELGIDPTPFVTLDADGDGADDIVYMSRETAAEAPRLVIRLGGYAPRSSASLVTNPFGPERAIETSLTDGSLAWITSGESADQHRFQVIDWDLDGRDDIAFVGTEPSGVLRLRVLRSLGTGRFEEVDGGLDMPSSSFEVLDFDGDGRTDIAVCSPDPSLGRWGVVQPPGWDGVPITPWIQQSPGRWQFARRPSSSAAWAPWLELSSLDRTDCAFEYGRGLPAVVESDGLVDRRPWDSRPLVVDLDGDGAQELVFAAQIYDNLDTPSSEAAYWMRSARWDGAEPVVRPLEVLQGRYQVADVNGDGYHDLMTTHWPLAASGNSPMNVPLLYVSLGTHDAVTLQPRMFEMPIDLAAPGRRFDRRGVDPATGVSQRRMLQFLSFDLAGDGRGDIVAATLPFDQPLATIDLCPGRPFCDAKAWADNQFWAVEWLATSYDQAFPTSMMQQGDWRAYDGRNLTLLTSEAHVLDADGDGALDILDLQRVDSRFIPNGNPTERPRIRGTMLQHNVRSQPALVERVTDGFGATILVDYTPLSDSSVYLPTRACAYPTRCTTDSRYVVQRVRRDSGLPETSFVEETHFYQGGRADVLGRGFLGFQRHVVRNLTSGQVEDRRFDNTTYDATTRSYPRAHRPRAIMSYRVDPTSPVGGSTVFVGSKQTFTYDLVTTDVGTHYVTVGSARTQAYEETTRPLVIAGGDPFLGRTAVRDTTTTTTYDEFGNPFVVTERIAGIPDAVLTRTTWINDTASWRIGLPDTQVARTNEGDQACSLEARTFYTVDVGLAEITSIRRTGRRPDPTMEREMRVVERDRFGNIVEIEILGDTGPRTVRIAYEPSGYFIDSITNGLGHTTSVDVEARFGQPHRTTDPNGVETVRSYDGFGRLRTERSSGRGGAEITYDLPDASGRHQIRVDPAEGGHEVVELDRLGRPVDRYADHAYLTSRTHLEYDALGRLTLETEPFTGDWSSAVPSTQHHFDGLGRPLFSVGADGERVDYAYPRNRRHVTRSGEGTRVIELDPAGRTLAAVEPGPSGGVGGRTAYQYCRSGLLRRTFDPAGARDHRRVRRSGSEDSARRSCGRPCALPLRCPR